MHPNRLRLQQTLPCEMSVVSEPFVVILIIIHLYHHQFLLRILGGVKEEMN